MKKVIKVLLVLIVLVVGMNWIEDAELNSMRFDSQAWARNEPRSTRVKMAGDWIRQLKAGQHDRESVEKMLGKPSGAESSNSSCEYTVGMTMFGFNNLIIVFDEEGRVKDAFLWRL